MYRNQIDLSKRKLKNNIKFTKLLHKSELKDSDRWFDYKGNGVVIRQRDDGMNLDKYVKLMERGIYHCKMDLGSSSFDSLRHIVVVDDAGIHRFAWVDCPYDENNFNEFSKAFGKAFHQKLSGMPVEPGLQKYHIGVAVGYGKKL